MVQFSIFAYRRSSEINMNMIEIFLDFWYFLIDFFVINNCIIVNRISDFPKYNL